MEPSEARSKAGKGQGGARRGKEGLRGALQERCAGAAGGQSLEREAEVGAARQLLVLLIGFRNQRRAVRQKALKRTARVLHARLLCGENGGDPCSSAEPTPEDGAVSSTGEGDPDPDLLWLFLWLLRCLGLLSSSLPFFLSSSLSLLPRSRSLRRLLRGQLQPGSVSGGALRPRESGRRGSRKPRAAGRMPRAELLAETGVADADCRTKLAGRRPLAAKEVGGNATAPSQIP